MATDKHSRGRPHVYLEDIPLDEATSRFHSALQQAGGLSRTASERVPLAEALHRVTAERVWARISSPHYHAAAMDGAAVRSADTTGASEKTPVRLRIGDQAQWVDTGMSMPEGFNAVVMIENIQEVGKDIVASELLLPEGLFLKPTDLGAMAQAGVTDVAVRRKPKVAIIPTGTELVLPGQSLKPGKIIESNSLVLAGLVEEWGAKATRRSPTPDDYDRLKKAIRDAVTDHD